MSQNDKDDCTCLACTLHRTLEGTNSKSSTKGSTSEPWMEILTKEQLDEVIEDAKKADSPLGPDMAVMTLLANLVSYASLSKVARQITDAIGAKYAPPFAADKMSKLRKQIKQLVDLI